MAEITRREFVQGIGSLGLVAATQTPGVGATHDSYLRPFFLEAQPIWPAGRTEEKNLFVGFRAVFQCGPDRKPILRITASTMYRCFLPTARYRVTNFDESGTVEMTGRDLMEGGLPVVLKLTPQAAIIVYKQVDGRQ